MRRGFVVIALAFLSILTGIHLAGCGISTGTQQWPPEGGGTASPLSIKTITLDPVQSTVPVGESQQIVAVGTMSNGTSAIVTSSVTWTSSDTSVATVSTGRVTAVKAGTATITASAEGGTVTATATVHVTSAALVSIEVLPANSVLSIGRTQQMHAWGVYADNTRFEVTTSSGWTSSQPAIATVGASTGVAEALAVGETEVTATKGVVSGKTKLTATSAVLVSMQVSPSTASVPVGKFQVFTASGTFSDGSHHPDMTASSTWTSSDSTVAHVVSPGLVTGVKPGRAVITALDPSTGIHDQASVTVTSAGQVVSIKVAPATPATLIVGKNGQFTAVATYDDGTSRDVTDEASWTSGDTTIVSISDTPGSNGLATGKKVGQTSIQATLAGKSDQATVNVTQKTLLALSVYSTDNMIVNGGTLQYRAVPFYDDYTTVPALDPATIAWASSNAAVATINGTGLATGQNTTAGDATIISATCQGITGRVNLLFNPTAAEKGATVTVYNNSGCPDEAVFVTLVGKDDSNNCYYTGFCKNVITAVAYPAATTGKQFSYPLVTLRATGTPHQYELDLPKTNMRSAHVNLSLGGGLLVGYSAAGFVEPDFNIPTPWDFFELDLNGTTIYANTTNVTNVSLMLNCTTVQNSGAQTSVGFNPDSRTPLLKKLRQDSAYSRLRYMTGFTTTRVLSPDKYLSYNGTDPMQNYLNAAIDSAWTKYKGYSNANIIAAGGWKYTPFTYRAMLKGEDPGFDDCINLVASDGALIHLAKPSGKDVFGCVLSGTESQKKIQSVLYAGLMRGVCDDYTKWGNHTNDVGDYTLYYKNTTLPYNHYGELLHSFAVMALHGGVTTLAPLCYAFPMDDIYKQDPTVPGLDVSTIKSITITIPPFDPTY